MIVVVCFKGDAILSPLVAEIKVLWCTLNFCLDIGICNIILDGDAKKVVDEVHSFKENLSMHGELIEDIKQFMKSRLDWISVCCPREGNVAACSLSKFSFNVNLEMVWLKVIPKCIYFCVFQEQLCIDVDYLMNISLD